MIYRRPKQFITELLSNTLGYLLSCEKFLKSVSHNFKVIDGCISNEIGVLSAIFWEDKKISD